MYTFKLMHLYSTEVHKMHVAVMDSHTGSVENIITVCLHALSGGGNAQQLYT